VTIVLAGCGAGTDPSQLPAPQACPAPGRLVGEACVQPGFSDDGCPAGTLGVDGDCIPAGLTPDDCVEGFAHDGDVGCVPVLPEQRCGPGLMAIPGETTCHAVMECVAGTWGGIVIEPATIFVDASYTGADADGTQTKPFATLEAALNVAPVGAHVAVAAGTYTADHYIDSSVRIDGVCPALVDIVGSGTVNSAIAISANDVELRGVSIRGPQIALLASGALNLLLDRIWVHDSAGGVGLVDSVGVVSATIVDSLIENHPMGGLQVVGSEVAVERSTIRGNVRGVTLSISCGPAGCDPTRGANAVIRSSVVEDNVDLGIFIVGSVGTIESTVIRGTFTDADDYPRGINLEMSCDSAGCDLTTRPTVFIRNVVMEANQGNSIRIRSGDATIEAVSVRDSLPRPASGLDGRGIAVEWPCPNGCGEGEESHLTISKTLVERSYDIGIMVSGSEASIESTVVRHSFGRAGDGKFGRGISAQPPCTSGICDSRFRSTIALRGSVIAASHDTGIFLSSSDATIEGTLVVATDPMVSSLLAGRGINAQFSCDLAMCDPTTRSTLALSGSRVELSYEVGLAIAGSDATITSTVIQDTASRAFDGLFGDGVMVSGLVIPASVSITTSQVTNSARAGLANFAAYAGIGDSTFQCSAFDFNGQSSNQPFVLENLGGVSCGCPTPDRDCKLVSAQLEPPTTLDSN
jgi:hypothetical protein